MIVLTCFNHITPVLGNPHITIATMVGGLRQACLWTWPRHGPEQTGDSVKHMWKHM